MSGPISVLYHCVCARTDQLQKRSTCQYVTLAVEHQHLCVFSAQDHLKGKRKKWMENGEDCDSMP